MDRDAFARFAGIGIGCQRFQAARVLDIQVGLDCDLPTGVGSVGLEADGSDDDGSDDDAEGDSG